MNAVLTAFTNLVKAEVMGNGNALRLPKFATFKQKLSPATSRHRNPISGDQVTVGTRTSVTFVPSKTYLRVKEETVGK